MKEILKNTFRMWFELPYKEMFNIISWSCKLYCLVFAPYLAAVIMGLFVSILFGGDFMYGVWDFTTAYFYDGQVLDLIAWRVHLTWFVICILLSINEELK